MPSCCVPRRGQSSGRTSRERGGGRKERERASSGVSFFYKDSSFTGLGLYPRALIIFLKVRSPNTMTPGVRASPSEFLGTHTAVRRKPRVECPCKLSPLWAPALMSPYLSSDLIHSGIVCFPDSYNRFYPQINLSPFPVPILLASGPPPRSSPVLELPSMGVPPQKRVPPSISAISASMGYRAQDQDLHQRLNLGRNSTVKSPGPTN